jgi:hypothetical protein
LIVTICMFDLAVAELRSSIVGFARSYPFFDIGNNGRSQHRNNSGNSLTKSLTGNLTSTLPWTVFHRNGSQHLGQLQRPFVAICCDPIALIITDSGYRSA